MAVSQVPPNPEPQAPTTHPTERVPSRWEPELAGQRWGDGLVDLDIPLTEAPQHAFQAAPDFPSDLLDAIRACAQAIGRPPTTADYDAWNIDGKAPARTGPWAIALHAALDA